MGFCEWFKIIIASLIGGLFPLLGVVFTVRSERKRIIFQSLYASKQILYSEIIEKLMKIRDSIFSPWVIAPSRSEREKLFTSHMGELRTHLIKLELIAPREIIECTRFFIRSIEELTTPIVVFPGESIEEKEERGKERDALREIIKKQCEKLAELLRKDLGVSKKMSS